MLGYHAYKLLHLIGLVFFLMALVKLHNGGTGKFFKSCLYSSAFLTLSTGTTLMLRWGLLESMPPWIWGKYLSMIGLILTIWFPGKASKLVVARPYFLGLMVLIGLGCSIYKPI